MRFKEISMEWYDPYDADVARRLISEGVDAGEARRNASLGRWASGRFSDMASCVTSMVERLADPYPYCDFRRLIVQCRSEFCEERLTLAAEGSRVAIIPCDPAPIFAMGDRARKEAVLKIVRRALHMLEREGIEVAPMSRACDAAAAADLENMWRWRRKPSPSRSKTAEVLVSHDTEAMGARLIVWGHRGQMIRSARIAEEAPSELGLYKFLGDLAWEGETVVVSSRYGFQSRLDTA